MMFNDYIKIIQLKSDIYLQLLCYLYQRCSFQETSVNMVSRVSSSDLVKGDLKLPTRKGSQSNMIDRLNELDFKAPTHKKLSENIKLSTPSKFSRFSPAHDFITKKTSGESSESDELDHKKKPKKKYDSFNELGSVEASGYNGMRQLNNGGPISKKKSQFSIAPDKISNNHISHENNTGLEIVESPEADDGIDNILMEGFLFKPNKNNDGLEKTFYIVLIGQDIHYYEDEKKTSFIKMHNISGGFIKANGEITIKSQKFYSFSIITDLKTRIFLTKNRENAKEWVKQLKKGMGYKNFFEFYEMLDNLGEGQFGQVKLGIKISTKEKVAIKIITKSKLKNEQVELLKSEIDIMKVCKHPNIVQFIDHFENSEYIFIVMEYLQHGHLRQYLTKKSFNITEKRIAQITHQVASALKYLEVYGIIHRDLKPDNILLADIGSNFTVKLMDFGLGKIIGHQEKTVEGYGTLCFVAPEIILRTPYNNSVDIWSFGVTLYYIASHSYPFDSNTDNEIAKKICYTPVEFADNIWIKKSKELKSLIKLCLEKDMKTRITLEGILKHDFLKMNQLI